MAVEIAPVNPGQVEELARICYDAFKDISDRHGFATDFDTPAFAQMVLTSLVHDEDCYSVAASAGGRLAGSNYLTAHDEVGGIGPVSVDPPAQGMGAGRALMEDVLKYARENGIEQVRLMQDSFNMMSLALYASLGFDTKTPVVMMEPVGKADPHVREATPDDLPAVEELSRRIYRVSRRNEVAHLFGSPFRPFVRERAGRITGYFLLGIAGHGVAQAEEDMVALVLHAAGLMPPQMARFFCPLTEGSLYRRFLAAGCRNRKVMNLMALGPYAEPDGVWLPSVSC
ncbi:MAG: GNAT family N-acetyltransferase [Dehalococcoidia bacterium]|nr:GNAT family N-acetyltransferase [Dehalococcoidia bacterium]